MILKNGVPGQAQVAHLPHLKPDQRRRCYGVVACARAEPVTAGSCPPLRFTYHLGEAGLPAGGALRLAWRWPFDWGPLQTEASDTPGHVRALGPAGVELAAVYEPNGDLNPWHHHLHLTPQNGALQAGDTVELHCGNDTAGWEAPTFASDSCGFIGLLNLDGGPDWIRLEGPDPLPIVAGEAVGLVAVGPSLAGTGQAQVWTVRGEDYWGNPAPLPSPPVFSAPSTAISAENINEPPAYRAFLSYPQAGLYRPVCTVPGTDLCAEGNPVRVTDEQPANTVFWGDLHSGQTAIGCGAGTLAAHYAYARDAAGLQFCSQQANDHYIDAPTWAQVRRQTEEFDTPSFVAFLGCEWSPLTPQGGDRNVIYRRDESRLRRSGRFFVEEQPDPEPDLPSAAEFLPAMRDEEVLINMHVGGRPTNLDFHEPAIELLAEIHSTHGTSEWFFLDALKRGYVLGVTAGADGVMGRPGACRPGRRVTRNVRSGLTAVYAPTLAREDLWEAFKERRCYATSGERILLEFWVNEKPMGTRLQTKDQPLIRLRAAGTAPLERVDLLRGTDVLCSWDLSIAAGKPSAWRMLWGGTQAHGTAHVQRAIWQGTLRLQGATFGDIHPVGLQSAADRVDLEAPDRIIWGGATAGNRMGFCFSVDEADRQSPGGGATLELASARCNLSRPLSSFGVEPVRIDAGGLDCTVEIGPAPDQDAPREVELEFRDPAPLQGEHPYWIRLVQTNQERAWSSPVYVDYTG